MFVSETPTKILKTGILLLGGAVISLSQPTLESMTTLNNIIALTALTFMTQSAMAQEVAPVQTMLITYSKEIPATSTYTVTHNSKSEVPVEVLEQINAHRRHDETVLWKVNDELEILIYPFGVRKEEGHE